LPEEQHSNPPVNGFEGEQTFHPSAHLQVDPVRFPEDRTARAAPRRQSHIALGAVCLPIQQPADTRTGGGPN
jgi:hypothetical protein